jgi:hypothetical protein
MRKRIIAIASMALAMAVFTFAADDPFTGVWREVQSKTEVANSEQWQIIPSRDGVSVRIGDQKPQYFAYGKDVYEGDGFYMKIVRVDAHTLIWTSKQRGGKLAYKFTFAASPDGHYLSWIQEHAGKKGSTEFRRIGSVETGDAFSGAWQPIPTCTIKVQGNKLDMVSAGPNPIGGKPNLTIKLNGKESKTGWSIKTIPAKGIAAKPIQTITKSSDGPGTKPLYQTIQAKRIDAQTIEIITKYSDGSLGTKTLYQVKGDMLLRTKSNLSRLQAGEEVITEYERVK